MKEIDQSIIKKLGLVELYKEDIEEIITILKEGGYSSIYLKSGEFEYQSNEIDRLKIDNSSLVIGTHNPSYINVTFNEGVKIYSSNSSINSIGTVHKIELFLNKKIRHMASVVTHAITLLIFTCIFGITLAIRFNEPFLIVPIYGCIFIPILFLGTNKIRRNILSTDKRSNLSWFGKNRDIIVKIIIGLIVTIVGGLIVNIVGGLILKYV